MTLTPETIASHCDALHHFCTHALAWAKFAKSLPPTSEIIAPHYDALHAIFAHMRSLGPNLQKVCLLAQPKPATSEKLAKGLIIVKLVCCLAWPSLSFFLTCLTLDLPPAFMFVVMCLVFMSGITICCSFLLEQINQAIFVIFMLKQVFQER